MKYQISATEYKNQSEARVLSPKLLVELFLNWNIALRLLRRFNFTW